MTSTEFYFLVLLLTASVTIVSTLMCYDCPLHHYDFLITPDNIPNCMNCTTIDTKQNFCSLNFYSDDNGKTSKLQANPNKGDEHASVSYISAGFDIPRGFDNTISIGLLYQCMTDNCNNPQMILKRILEASTIETYKPPQLSFATDLSPRAEPLTCFTYNNFTNSDECKPLFHNRQSSNAAEVCSTYCVTEIHIDSIDLKTERMCSYCEQNTKERFSYIDERVYLLDQRISRLQQLEYICNTSRDCNSLENIRQIQQRYKIEFDFDKFFNNSGTSMLILSVRMQYIGYFLFIILIWLNNKY
ncbi:unnamed protein product [Adineta steineri]|uniref:Uncharacterized protein n=1 Tax=Adineta steineri TaxID=433720 RepID=A0A815BMX6_9BILA|nr:unnamed protein product [Adineta steineri]